MWSASVTAEAVSRVSLTTTAVLVGQFSATPSLNPCNNPDMGPCVCVHMCTWVCA